MDILLYNELNTKKIKKSFEKIVNMIKNDDFKSAGVKKLSNTSFYRAKLDYENRLLFKIIKHDNKKYALLLEIIYNHNYEKSRFLNGTKIDDKKLESLHDIKNISDNTVEKIRYVNKNSSNINILDKIISFDEEQQKIFNLKPPTIIIGSAGSGKTALILEKIKDLCGDILYITHSPYLVDNSRNIYFSFNYENDNQNIDFLSFKEYLETIKIPEGKEVDFKIFYNWFLRHSYTSKIKNCHKLYEEFNGVITGSSIKNEYLSRREYIDSVIKQSIFIKSERSIVYDYFEKYLQFIKKESYFDINIKSYEYLKFCMKKYDFIIVDEVQDLTNIQLSLILKSLNTQNNFVLCGDSNQIVHPNFFSWAKIKTLFYEESIKKNNKTEISKNIIRVLNNNYRNSPEITDLANKLLLIKNARFGSIDKETNYLVKSVTKSTGKIEFFREDEKIKRDLNKKTGKSTKFAVLVMRNEEKEEVKKYFKTPLVFSIQEAKGLEYENIILCNFISNNEKNFNEIIKGVTENDLKKDLTYSRAKDKEDKSIEAYKFYINSLYVAITRAIKNIYIFEKLHKHPMLSLLNINQVKNSINVNISDSSIEEWKNEAGKLELQGKKEQAEKIRKDILGTKEVPWKIINKDNFYKLTEEAFDENRYNRQAKLKIYEYALEYNIPYIFERLINFKFNKVLNSQANKATLLKKYTRDYSEKSYKELLKKINLYGIDFRNQFNQTPLMMSAKIGKADLLDLLISNKADINLLDNCGLNPLQISLGKAYKSERFATESIGKIYTKLVPSFIKIKVDKHLVKLDNKKMEFFLLNSMISIFQGIVRVKIKYNTPAFETGDFFFALEYFPEHVIPEKRKKRSYISSILSKNEINSNSPYNNKLFVRVRRGFYIINPLLELLINNSWVNVYDVINIDFLEKEIHDKKLQQLIKLIKKIQMEGSYQ